MEGVIKFLGTKRSSEELKTALDVIEEFKSFETKEEWIECPFSCWVKLEQLQDYLKLLTNTGVEDVDDYKAIKYLEQIRTNGKSEDGKSKPKWLQ